MTRKKPQSAQPLFESFDPSAPENITDATDERSSLVTADASAAAQAAATPQSVPQPAAEEGGPPGPGDLVVLVDSHSLIYQVFHAMPTMTAPDGTEVGAIHGFLRDLADIRERYDPDFLICCFDLSEITFRNELYADYKAHREPMPAALAQQIGRIRDSLGPMGIPSIAAAGFEADDLLATFACDAAGRGAQVLLVTSDKDCRQLLSDRVQMLNLRKQTRFGPAELLEDWGVRPDQVVDFQSLVGDSVDNVPGVPKIGPKAAKDLLTEFDSLDGIYANLDKIAAAARRKTLEEHRREAYQSRELVELKCDVPIEIDWTAVRRMAMDRPALETLFQQLGFRQLAQRILAQTDAASPAKSAAGIDRSMYGCIDSVEKLDELIDTLEKAPIDATSTAAWLSIDTETTSTDPNSARLVGISLAGRGVTGAYIPVAGPADQAERILPLESVREKLQPILASSIPKVGQNIKYDLIVLRNHG